MNRTELADLIEDIGYYRTLRALAEHDGDSNAATRYAQRVDDKNARLAAELDRLDVLGVLA